MSRISSSVVLDGDGKQLGFLRLPFSSHESAYGWIPIPIACISRGTGPTVLLIAGNHGDEYEGQIALARLCQALEPAEIRGRIIILPAANFPAVMAGRRVSPLDDGNLNRSFPGFEGGSPTEMIAHFIEAKLLPMSAYVIDLHSGGSSLEYRPTIRARFNSEPEMMRRTIELLHAFGAPYGCIFKPLAGENRTMAAAADRCKVVYLCAEIGGGGRITRANLALAEAGVRRVLAAVGVVDGHHEAPAETRVLAINGFENYVYAPENGLFEPLAHTGDFVTEGQPAGLIHFPDTPWQKPATTYFQTPGTILCRRALTLTRRGDCLYEVGNEVSNT